MGSYYSEAKKQARQKRFEIEMDEKIIELIKNDDYYTWLNNFSNKMPIFTQLEDLDIEEADQKNVNKLHVLYKMIENYAIRNDIPISRFNEGLGLYYTVNNLGINYEIGLTKLNDDVVFFCSRCFDDKKINSINIGDIRGEYYLKKSKELEELRQLKSMVIDLLDKGISRDEILTFVNEGINEKRIKLK